MTDQISFFPPIELDPKNAGWSLYPGDTVAHFYIGAFSLCGKSWRVNQDDPLVTPAAGDTVCAPCYVSACILSVRDELDLILTALAALGPLDDAEPTPEVKAQEATPAKKAPAKKG